MDWLLKWLRAFSPRKGLGWLGLLTADGRRAWAFLSLLGASGVMTGFAAFAMWLVKASPTYVLWMGFAAHGQLFVCLTGFMAMFVKRDIAGDIKNGTFSVKDKTNAEPHQAEPVEGAGDSDRAS